MRRSNELTVEEKKLLKRSLTDEEAIEKFERHCMLKKLKLATIEYCRNVFSSF
ncbi:hypothetical protein [Heyndrickxia acidicola]|uniref:Uncharacterized protein n=1 Tax=Heyndrickxia acidicola TaxID=209389 RepID=A0ABU6MFC8_9BACI|nr:hypothetical protein [Heyndrickxia acidicola]MED1203077.1 hypothetical protein [Heyndrickxia acidicola]